MMEWLAVRHLKMITRYIMDTRLLDLALHKGSFIDLESPHS